MANTDNNNNNTKDNNNNNTKDNTKDNTIDNNNTKDNNNTIDDDDEYNKRIKRTGCYKEHILLFDCHFKYKDFRQVNTTTVVL